MTTFYNVQVTESQIVKMIAECEEDCCVVVNGFTVTRRVWSWTVVKGTQAKVFSKVEDIVEFIGGAK